VYVITGGLGGIGLALADYLAETVQARLVLVGRSELPAPAAWDRWLAEHGDDERHSRTILKIRALEAKGAQVVCIGADVADPAEVEAMLAAAQVRFGPVNGLIHSAGVAGGGLLALKSRDMIGRVVRPKIDGSAVLVSATATMNLDFFVMCSSLASVIGEVAQFDYSAANAFQDGLAHRYKDARTHYMSINWDAWAEVGMAVDTEVPAWMQASKQAHLSSAILSAEGRQLFARALGLGRSQVVVSTSELNAALRAARQAAAAVGGGASATSGLDSRLQLEDVFGNPQRPVHAHLADIVRQLLGVTSVGLEDDFFALGGDSLLLVKLVAEINAFWKIKLPLRLVFENAMIKTVASHIEGLLEIKNEVQLDEDSVAEDGLI
jgi:NAD(P)-dependent dehydrogenase (short-subunit alcohol dehydrogenase family)/acyl carrier protein